MMLRKLAVSLAVAGVIGASNANALGLGEIKINSALNEPLSAEIKLLQVRQLSPLQIQPRMADIDEFALAGLDRSRFLSDVSFQVKVNPDGTGLITLRSKNPVREPFLNFLVEINWPNGRLVREYTLLLDPPVFDPTPVRQTVQPAAAEAPAPKKSVSPRPVVTAPAVTGSTGAAQSQVYVDNKDTLWGIALKHRPSKSVPVRRMMIAIQDKNPDAFIGGNINRLKAGVTLKMPTPEELNKLDNAQVLREFERQTESWRGKDKTEKAPVDASAKKAVTESVPEQPAPEDDKSAELKIVTPKDSIEPEEGVATDQADKDPAVKPEMKDEAGVPVAADSEKQALMEQNQDLEDRLNQSLENVDKVSRENAELNERLDSIQYELEKLREMLELKDQEMASLQNEVAKAKAAPAPAPAPAPEKGLLDTILQSPAMLGGIGAGLIALLAGLLFFLRRNKKEEEAEESDALVQVPDELNTPQTDADDTDVEEVATAEVTEELQDDVADDLEEVSDLEDISDLEDLEDLNDVDDLDIGDEEDLLNDSDLNLDDAGDISDLDDLDLDMDLNLEDEVAGAALEKVEDNSEADDELDALLQDDEFDLGIDDDEDESAESAEDEEDPLDAILDEMPDAADESEEVEEAAADDALDDILGEISDEDESADDDLELDLELGDDLEFDVEEMAQPEPEQSADDAEEDGLDFVVDQVPDLVEAEEPAKAEESSAEADDELDLELGEDLDDILSGSDDSEEPEEAASEVDDANDDLEALMASDLDMSELEAAPEEADEPAAEPEPETAAAEDDEELDADLEAMLAANPDPQDLAVAVKDKIEVQEDFEDLDFESDEGFDELLEKVDEDIDLAMAAEPEEEESSEESDAAADDLDAMLDDIGSGIDEEMAAAPAADGKEEIDLEDDGLLSGAHDLEAELDSELNALLEGGDSDFELDETMTDAEDGSVDEDFDELAGLNLLEGADEVETKLDLARAYMDMEDLAGAKDILEEIILEGSDEQKKEAEALIRSMNES